MEPQTERTSCSGDFMRLLRQKATSERWAMAASIPRTDSWLSAEPMVTRQSRPTMTEVLAMRSKGRNLGLPPSSSQSG